MRKKTKNQLLTTSIDTIESISDAKSNLYKEILNKNSESESESVKLILDYIKLSIALLEAESIYRILKKP